MEIKSGSKKIEIPDSKIKKAGFFGRFRGLMFRKREKAPIILLFDSKKSIREPIHSWFVFFPFFVLWLDSKNNIIEKKFVHPGKISISPSGKFKKLLEIPVNSNSEETIKKILGPSTEIRKI